jgi:hypothetical protein
MTITLRGAVDRYVIHQMHSLSLMKAGVIPRGETVALGSERMLILGGASQPFYPVEGNECFLRKSDVLRQGLHSAQ